jgi:molecular chaperone GrpE
MRGAVAPLQEWARARADAEQGQAILDSLVVGYTMSLQRLDRALEQHGLEPIACVGLPFDPEIMEVVEVVKDESRSGSAVIEDVRPGYRYRGQLFRCAQVRVARP